MRRYLFAAAVVGLALPAVAAAKGPVSATISGPGLERSLAIKGDGEGPGTALGTLASSSGFFAQMFGQSPDPTLASRPSGTLGPRYTVVYTVPGPDTSTLTQDLYPYASGGPVSHLLPRQRFWGTQETVGGWFRGNAELKQMLVRAGLPQTAPALARARAGSTRSVAIAAGFGLVVAGAALAALRRRR
jgi:hypothetical protein